MHSKYSTLHPSVQVSSINSQYTAAKRANLVLAGVLDDLNDRRAFAVRTCSRVMSVHWCPSCMIMHTTDTLTCKHRLCPICQVRRSRKLARESIDAFALMRSTGEMDNASLYLLTLTIKNVDNGALADAIDGLLDGLRRLRKTRPVARALIGSARNIEITYNYTTHTYHPHVHMILILKNDVERQLRTKKYWRALWGDLMRLNYSPVIDIEPIKDDGAIYEVSKYVAKSMAILSNLQGEELVGVVDELNRALYDRTMVAYTGAWRRARRALKLVDDDDGTDVDAAACACGGALLDVVMRWSGSEYQVVQEGGIDSPRVNLAAQLMADVEGQSSSQNRSVPPSRP